MFLGLGLGFTPAHGGTVLYVSNELMESGYRITLESGTGFAILEN